jgi:hypothetical protein
MRLGLGEDADTLIALLAMFARRSAIVTHPRGTRRYGGYVLDVEGLRIYGISRLEDHRSVCPDCHGLGRHRMHDDCRWIEIPCQTCKEVSK